MNNSQEIILAQISAIYDKPPFVKVKTGQMEMILKCVGLGKYYDEYQRILQPGSFCQNRGSRPCDAEKRNVSRRIPPVWIPAGPERLS